GLAELSGIYLVDDEGQRVEGEDGAVVFSIGATETLTDVSRHPLVRKLYPSLAAAAGQVAGPQIRNQGTLGGNLCLDTRCTYYNQTEFWRNSLGYCLKKDGDVCHVTKVGKKCVAAHSADTPPVLITLGATVVLASADGEREVAVADFFVADGTWNTVRQHEEIVKRVRIPLPSPRLRTAYKKVRQRNSIDFPLLSIALATELEDDGVVRDISLVVSALGARPRELSGLVERTAGKPLEDSIEDIAEISFKQCHPLENIIVDPEWRRAMVPVYVTRVLEEVADSD
ncbi:MAG TPA: FAD binding domain-containing protein, partial [Longimicrobiaceae bacterium]|nr:FAD binding domain-containing protein [Longimicrobiaceae bacterium]